MRWSFSSFLLIACGGTQTFPDAGDAALDDALTSDVADSNPAADAGDEDAGSSDGPAFDVKNVNNGCHPGQERTCVHFPRRAIEFPAP